ncbi:DEAD/DEAH box helicase [Nakamurella panacisegetis]|uniref:hypothetical protein n=1 Tax=Nakamurella panacisegetis TaxID=1090615 RepID=UPI000B88A382|nr:hypothetical protein [Nakamurella panacisegetis]
MPPTSRRRTSRRRTTGTAGRTTRPDPIPVPSEGRLWLLDVPFGIKVPGTTYDAARKVYVHAGAELPPDLVPYRSQPLTWLRWLEDDANSTDGRITAEPAGMTPRALQTEGAAMILAAATSEIGGAPARGVLLTDDVGTGKTLTAWLGLLAVARERGARNVLVLVDRPKQITIPHWRRTILAAGTDGLRVLICSPDELGRLLVRGRPRWTMDIVIADESHLYRNVETQRVQRFRRVTRFTDPHHKAPFVIHLTATPANHPAELTYLAPLLAQVHGEPVARWTDFGNRLLEAELPLARAYGKWTWNDRAGADGGIRAQGSATVRGWLADARPPLTLHRPAPWGPAPLELLPVQLSPDETLAYRTAWTQFQRALADLAADREVMARPARRTASGRAAVLRLRQKASLLRVASTAQWATAVVKAGRQAVISCEFISAAAEPIAENLEAAGIPVARLYGTQDLEEQRLRFQRGGAPVVVFTPSTSLSLHAGELLPGGPASPATREGLMHNVRYSGLQGRQILGRSHRDGQVCPWWLGYAEGTVEETIAQIMIGRFFAADHTAGADSAALGEVAAALGVSWLPTSALESAGE